LPFAFSQGELVPGICPGVAQHLKPVLGADGPGSQRFTAVPVVDEVPGGGDLRGDLLQGGVELAWIPLAPGPGPGAADQDREESQVGEVPGGLGGARGGDDRFRAVRAEQGAEAFLEVQGGGGQAFGGRSAVEPCAAGGDGPAGDAGGAAGVAGAALGGVETAGFQSRD
jgi:hypothetical protein